MLDQYDTLSECLCIFTDLILFFSNTYRRICQNCRTGYENSSKQLETRLY